MRPPKDFRSAFRSLATLFRFLLRDTGCLAVSTPTATARSEPATRPWRPGIAASASPCAARKTCASSPAKAASATTSTCRARPTRSMVRSPHAHARIRAIDTRPGARRAWRARGADRTRSARRRPEADSRIKPFTAIPRTSRSRTRTARRSSRAAHFPLPPDKVRHVGEAIAMVIAETVAAAKDGAEQRGCRLRAAARRHRCACAAAQPDAPRLWDEAPPMCCIDAEVGDAAATAAAFARAAHVVQARRPGCSASPACRWSRARRSASYDPRRSATRCTPAAAARGGSRPTSRHARRPREQAVRVLMRDVGGNFGTRGMIYPGIRAGGLGGAPRRPPGQMDLRAAAKRSLSDYQGRDLAVEAELALDAERHFSRDARLEHRQSRRAHRRTSRRCRRASRSCRASTACRPRCFRARGVLSNTTPTRPYRSSGRPEVMFVMERLIDLAARAVRLRPRRAAPPQPAHAAGAALHATRSAWSTTAATTTT